MRLVVGLGNPGKEYKNTRHNAGFMVIEKIINNEQLTISKSVKTFSKIAKGKITGRATGEIVFNFSKYS